MRLILYLLYLLWSATLPRWRLILGAGANGHQGIVKVVLFDLEIAASVRHRQSLPWLLLLFVVNRLIVVITGQLERRWTRQFLHLWTVGLSIRLILRRMRRGDAEQGFAARPEEGTRQPRAGVFPGRDALVAARAHAKRRQAGAAGHPRPGSSTAESMSTENSGGEPGGCRGSHA